MKVAIRLRGRPVRGVRPARKQSDAWVWWLGLGALATLAALGWRFSIGRSDNANALPSLAVETPVVAAAGFTDMSYADHVRQAELAAMPGNTVDQIDAGLHHARAVPPWALLDADKAKVLELKLIAARREREAERADASLARETAVLLAKRVLRETIAKTVEESLLEHGFTASVSIHNRERPVLHITWVSVSKTEVNQLSEQEEFLDSARIAEFEGIEITDGHGKTWFWNLDDASEPSGLFDK